MALDEGAQTLMREMMQGRLADAKTSLASAIERRDYFTGEAAKYDAMAQAKQGEIDTIESILSQNGVASEVMA